MVDGFPPPGENTLGGKQSGVGVPGGFCLHWVGYGFWTSGCGAMQKGWSSAQESVWASVGWLVAKITDLDPTAPGEGQRERERGQGATPGDPSLNRDGKSGPPGSEAERPQEEGRQISRNH